MKGRARLLPLLPALCMGLLAVVVVAVAAVELGAGLDAVVPRQAVDWPENQAAADDDLGLAAMAVADEGQDEAEQQEEAPATVQMELSSQRKRFIPKLPKRGMSKIAYFKELRRETISRRLREGGMLRRYAPELFNADVYGVDDNDNVKVGSRATIWDAMNGPFAPMKPQRPPVDAGVLSRLLNADEKQHLLKDRRDKIRHIEDAAALAGRDPYAAGYTYLPANHRTKPFGWGRIIARARHWQALDVGPFERSPRTWNHAAQNPMAAFKGYDHSPLPYTPHLPFAESDAAFQGARPSKLQQFQDFVPPPEMPKFAARPEEKGGGGGGGEKED